MIQGSFRGVVRVLRLAFKKGSRMFQESFKMGQEVSKKFQRGFKRVSWKGVVASYQVALSKEQTPLEGGYPVLTWLRDDPGYKKMVSEDKTK